MDNLRKTLATARANGTEVRGIAIINPGNPTGNILAEEQIKDIIKVDTANTNEAKYLSLVTAVSRHHSFGERGNREPEL